MTRRIARVLLDSPLPQLDRLFDYAVPPALTGDAVPGVRVKVPLRSAGRVVEGWVVEVADVTGDERPLSEVDAVVSSVAVLPERLYALARRVADRAAGSASAILRLAIPKRMVRAEKTRLAAGPPSPVEVSEQARERADYALSPFPGAADAIASGARVALDAPPVPAAGGLVAGEWARIVAAAAVRTLAGGRSAVVVVPDYRDQGQLERALAELVPSEAVVRDDADQSGPARYAQFLRTLDEAPCIVIGRRSAVYSAVRAGLVVIWDDGDPLLLEPLSPGVHARDAALVRQELEGSALLFVGHTRTSDVQRLVEVGWVRDIPARRRLSPRVVLSATREGERGSRVPSAAFAAARDALPSGPVLVQVARPGYAPSLVCAECRRPARCLQCSGPLRAARPGATPVCAWCGRSAHGWACPHCAAHAVRMASSGSERTADELGRAFPGTRVIVSDGAHPVAEVEPRPALVIATRGAEPLVAGGYRAVLLLDGERMLLSEALRIGEDCLRWWSNAAALAAPGAPVHLVGVTGPVARSLATWTQPAYAREELAERAPLHMPPAVRLASVEGAPAAVDAALSTLRTDVPALAPEAIVGPVPVAGAAEAVARALVRFDYPSGRAVAESLRSSVVADALRARGARGKGPRARSTLRVRLDVPDPVL